MKEKAKVIKMRTKKRLSPKPHTQMVKETSSPSLQRKLKNSRSKKNQRRKSLKKYYLNILMKHQKE